MNVIDWFRRRKPMTVEEVADFARVARDQDLSLDYDRDERLAKLLESDDPGNIDEIAKLLGQYGNDPKP